MADEEAKQKEALNATLKEYISEWRATREKMFLVYLFLVLTNKKYGRGVVFQTVSLELVLNCA